MKTDLPQETSLHCSERTQIMEIGFEQYFEIEFPKTISNRSGVDSCTDPDRLLDRTNKLMELAAIVCNSYFTSDMNFKKVGKCNSAAIADKWEDMVYNMVFKYI